VPGPLNCPVPDRSPLTIATSRYQAREKIAASGLAPVGTTVGGPRFKLGYELAGMASKLAPYGLLHVEDPADFARAYRRRLDSVGVGPIRSLLGELAGNARAEGVVLLCFEDLGRPGEWCHRRVFAEWWQEQTGEFVDEL
jgi:hypothetical protein